MTAITRLKSLLGQPWLDRWIGGSDLLQSASAQTCVGQLYDESIWEYRRNQRMRAIRVDMRSIQRRFEMLDRMRRRYSHEIHVICDCADESLRLRKRANELKDELARLLSAVRP